MLSIPCTCYLCLQDALLAECYLMSNMLFSIKNKNKKHKKTQRNPKMNTFLSTLYARAQQLPQ